MDSNIKKLSDAMWPLTSKNSGGTEKAIWLKGSCANVTLLIACVVTLNAQFHIAVFHAEGTHIL